MRLRSRTNQASTTLDAFLAADSAYWAAQPDPAPPARATAPSPSAASRDRLTYRHPSFYQAREPNGGRFARKPTFGPADSGCAQPTPNAARVTANAAYANTAGFGPDSGIDMALRAGGTPLLERDSCAVAAPPAVTPVGAAPGRPLTTRERRHAAARAANGGRIGTGSVVAGGFALGGRDWARKARSGGPLSEAEAMAIAAHVAAQRSAGAAVVASRAGRRPSRPLPSDSGDRTRAVFRLTHRVIGRPVGIRETVTGLRRIGFVV